MALSKKKSTAFYSLLIIFSFCTACKKTADITTPPPPPPPANSVPVISTSGSFSASLYTITCGGSISSNGGLAVIEKGICFNTLPAPTILNSKTISTDTLSNFTVTVTNVLPNTTYYIRAYATNSMGTSYGNQVTITTAGTVSNSDAGGTMYIVGLNSGNSSYNLLYAVNAKDGATKWIKTFPTYITKPLVYNNKIYVACDNGSFYALDTLGNIKWTLPNVYGADKAPVAGNGLVYLFGYPSPSSSVRTLYAVNSEVGSIVWSVGSTFGQIASAALSYQKSDNTLITATQYSINALNGSTGIVKWQRSGLGFSGFDVLNDRIYTNALSGDGKDSLLALSTVTGAATWYKKSTVSQYNDIRSVRVKNGNIYSMNEAGSDTKLYVYDSATGNPRFAPIDRNFAGSYGYDDEPIIVDSLIFVNKGFAGSINIFNSLTGKYLYDLPTVNGASADCIPTIVGDIVYYRQSSSFFVDPITLGGYYASYLHAYNFRTKAFIWSKEFKNVAFYYGGAGLTSTSGTFYRGIYSHKN